MTSLLGTRPIVGATGCLAHSTLTRQRTERPEHSGHWATSPIQDQFPAGGPYVHHAVSGTPPRLYLNFRQTDGRLERFPRYWDTRFRRPCGSDKSTPCPRREANNRTREVGGIPDHHDARRGCNLDAITVPDAAARLAPYARMNIEGRHIGMLPRIRIAGAR
jgi:hypothetical protein